MNFLDPEIQNFLQVLQKNYNVLIIFHPSKPDEKRYFVVSSFTPSQNQIFDHTLQGKEITDLLNNQFFSVVLNGSTSQAISPVQRQTLDTKLDELQERRIKFSKDYSYEWWLM